MKDGEYKKTKLFGEFKEYDNLLNLIKDKRIFEL